MGAYKRSILRGRLVSALGLSVLIALTLAGCGQPPRSTLTTLSAASGNVTLMKAGTNDWIAAEVGMALEVGDTIKSSNNSTAEITFFDGSTIDLEAGTEITIISLDISTTTGSTTITLEQIIGTTVSRVVKLLDPASRYEVETPSGVATVRGSIMQVHVTEDGTTWITNLEGDIWAVAQGVELQVPKGQQCIIRPGQPPQLIMVAAGSHHTVGLKADGTVVAVGLDDEEQCSVGNWTGITQVAAGRYHTVGLKNDGTVVAVGWDSDGQCDVGGWTGIVQVAAGELHTVGLRANGSVVAMGDNDFSQCDVDDWTDIVQVAAGGLHTVGLKSDGTVVAVGVSGGESDYGQCDVGNWTGIIQVAAGHYHTVGLSSDGSVVAVGLDSSGQCNVGGWTSIIQLATGFAHTVGLKTGGIVVAVGDDDYDQCDVGSWDLK